LAELFTSLVPNLVQGVSQQPDAQRDPSQAEIQINGVSSLVEGLRKRDPSQTLAEVSATTLGDVFVHPILRDSTEKYLAAISKDWVKVYDLNGVAQTVSAPGGYGYLASVVDAKKEIRAVTVADFTFISNTRTKCAMDAALAPSVARPAHEALVWVKAANYGQAYKVNLNGVLVTVTTSVAPVITSGGVPTTYLISAADIAEQIKVALVGVTAVTITRSGSVLHLTSASPITLSATDARANADITAITSSVQAFGELPTIGPEGYLIEVVGDPGNKFDGFYVKFVPRVGAGTFGEGAWEETVSPGVEYKINPATMPHVLVRLPSGTFHFGPVNGAALTGFTLPTWGERVAGDYDTAPDPGFIGQPINDVFVYKNRLGFLADENVILSRARSFFDFFPETVTTILDSDPVDRTASNNRVSNLRYAVPFQDELIIFSDQYQFRFNTTDSVLTPTTAQITVLTQYEIDPQVRPIQVAGSIVFAQANGEWTQFREFSVRGVGTALVADAASLTEYCSSYVPSDVTQLQANDTGNAWYAISSKPGYLNRIYTYKFFYRNSGNGVERVQSSWSYWEFNPTCKVLAILCIVEKLYLLMRHGGKVYLEVMPVQDRQSVELAPYPLLLDRWVSTTTDTPASMRVAPGTYSAITGKTTWTLPFPAQALTQAWSAYQPNFPGGAMLGSTESGTTVQAQGDWSGAQVYFGEAYNFSYRFTRFKIYREQGSGKVASNMLRAQIRHAKLRYHETGWFRVRVTPSAGRAPAVYQFPGSTVSLLAGSQGSDLDLSGIFTIPILGRGENVTVDLENNTAHPCKFSTLEWIGLITGKGRAM
jgi:hypothetical protein